MPTNNNPKQKRVSSPLPINSTILTTEIQCQSSSNDTTGQKQISMGTKPSTINDSNHQANVINEESSPKVPVGISGKSGKLPPLLLQCKHLLTYEGLDPWHIRQLQCKLSLLVECVDCLDLSRYPWHKDMGINQYRMKVPSTTTPTSGNTPSTNAIHNNTSMMERIRFIMDFEEPLPHVFQELIRDYSMIYNLQNFTNYFWKNNIVSKRVIHPINQTTGFAILELAGTWPGMNRDSLVIYHFQCLQDGRVIYMMFSVDQLLNECFAIRKTVVRANVEMFGFVLESLNTQRTRVTGIWQCDCKGIITSMMMNSLLTSFLPHIGKPVPVKERAQPLSLSPLLPSMDDILPIANEVTKDPDVMDVAAEMVQQQNLYYLSIIARLWLASSSATGITLLIKLLLWPPLDNVNGTTMIRADSVELFTPFVTSSIIILTSYLFTTKMDATNEVEDITNTIIRAFIRISMLFFGAFTTWCLLCRFIFASSSSQMLTTAIASEGENEGRSAQLTWFLSQYSYPPLMEGIAISGILLVYGLLICFKHADQMPEALPPRWKVMRKKDVKVSLTVKALLSEHSISSSNSNGGTGSDSISQSNSNSKVTNSSNCKQNVIQTWAIYLPLQ